MSKSKLYRTWGLGNDNRTALSRRLDHFRVFASLLRHCSDWRSKLTILYLIAQRLGISFRILPADAVASRSQVYSVKLQNQRIWFSLLEDLQPWIEINWELGYERLPNFRIQPGWTVTDVGSNLGVFSLRAAQQGAKIFAFEPDPVAFKLLQMNLAGNGGSNVVAYQKALGKEGSRGWINLDKAITVSSVVHVGANTAPNEITTAVVEIVALDSFVAEANLSRIDLLKIDAEGAEVGILEGAPKALSITERLVIEFHNDITKGALTHVDRILSQSGFGQVFRHDYTPDLIGIVYYQRI